MKIANTNIAYFPGITSNKLKVVDLKEFENKLNSSFSTHEFLKGNDLLVKPYFTCIVQTQTPFSVSDTSLLDKTFTDVIVKVFNSLFTDGIIKTKFCSTFIRKATRHSRTKNTTHLFEYEFRYYIVKYVIKLRLLQQLVEKDFNEIATTHKFDENVYKTTGQYISAINCIQKFGTAPYILQPLETFPICDYVIQYIEGTEELLDFDYDTDISTSKKELKGFIYIMHVREFLNANLNIYKIGRTICVNKRICGYPKGTECKFFTTVDNAVLCENELIKIFKSTFTHRKDLGAEYFEGNLNLMKKIISDYVFTNNRDNEIFIAIPIVQALEASNNSNDSLVLEVSTSTFLEKFFKHLCNNLIKTTQPRTIKLGSDLYDEFTKFGLSIDQDFETNGQRIGKEMKKHIEASKGAIKKIRNYTIKRIVAYEFNHEAFQKYVKTMANV